MRLASLLLVLTVALSSGQPPYGPSELAEPTFLTYTAEALGGYVGGVGGFLLGAVCGQKLLSSKDADLRSPPQLFVGLTTAVVGVAGGTYLTGAAFRQGGKFLPTLAYTAGDAAIGTGLSLIGGALVFGTDGPMEGVGFALFLTGIAAVGVSPCVATWGYNQSRYSWFASRIRPGSVALGSVLDENGTPSLSLDVRALTVRF